MVNAMAYPTANDTDFRRYGSLNSSKTIHKKSEVNSPGHLSFYIGFQQSIRPITQSRIWQKYQVEMLHDTRLCFVVIIEHVAKRGFNYLASNSYSKKDKINKLLLKFFNEKLSAHSLLT